VNAAIFLDRDGVINELIYYPEHSIIDSPFTENQFKLTLSAGEAIKKFHELGFKVIVISNQPGIAKGNLSATAFEAISREMSEQLAEVGASLDGEYYCLHHPEAKVQSLKTKCSCRKPEPGLIFQAAKDMSIDLSRSWMIGDGLTDIKAGKKAGCRTILIGRMKCESCQLMDEQDSHPDFIAPDLLEASRIVEKERSIYGHLH
jgi:D-glycero-D-manno-heptose 1,7-bisphosphate phosphatase